METVFFLKGLIIGFVIAAPVGPIGVLCARRTLMHGRRAGFYSGMGAATADAIYGFIAAFGLTFISAFLLPLTFITGLYGMNIGLPFQGHPKAFLVLGIAMVVIVIGMVAYFRRKSWL